MVLEFCPVCSRLLQLKEDNGRIIGWCSCGFKRMQGIELNSESIDKVCRKCGYDKAEIAELQSGESTIFIYTCLKCKGVEREVQGSSKF
jgi:DNA-directed RNA polymerase subunit M/transcription elongation factor TFIIS